MMDDELADAPRIIITPIQLAAILDGQTIGGKERLTNRMWGAATLVGGALELVGTVGLALIPEPTMASKAGAFILGVHGIDTVQTGARQLWTGQPITSFTAAGASAAAQALGADTQSSQTTGAVVDTLVPLITLGAFAAVRAVSVRQGTIKLLEHEGDALGHTIAQHVAKDDATLLSRLATSRRIPAASSFTSIEEAETSVSVAIRRSKSDIIAWAKTAAPGSRLARTVDLNRVVGYGIRRGSIAREDMTKVTFVLEKISSNGRIYFIVTSYPAI